MEARIVQAGLWPQMLLGMADSSMSFSTSRTVQKPQASHNPPGPLHSGGAAAGTIEPEGNQPAQPGGCERALVPPCCASPASRSCSWSGAVQAQLPQDSVSPQRDAVHPEGRRPRPSHQHEGCGDAVHPLAPRCSAWSWNQAGGSQPACAAGAAACTAGCQRSSALWWPAAGRRLGWRRPGR